ncbi:MAG: tetratricopeptide repeat protein, partial [Nitrospiraceae bacterium]
MPNHYTSSDSGVDVISPSGGVASASRPGVVAARWLLLVTFLHTVPSFFYFAIIIGFVPTVALLVGSVVSLLIGDGESFAMGVMFGVPALLYCGLYYLIARFLSKRIFLLQRNSQRTGVLLVIVGALLLMTLAPVYTIAGHSGGAPLNIIQLWQGFQPSTEGLIAYATVLALVLTTLAFAQHSPGSLAWPWTRYGARLIPGRHVTAWVVIFAVLVTGSLTVYQNRAWMICKPLAHAGQAWAQVCLARAMQARPGSARSDVSAVTWYERAAAQGNVAAIRELVKITRAPGPRTKWLRVLAERGEPDSQFELFQLLVRKGRSADQLDEAFSWLQEAAGDDHAEAQFELGWYYFHGKERGGRYRFGVTRDRRMARKWWERAAALGSGSAMNELAWRYEQGADEFPVDTEQAGELYEKIASGLERGRYGFKADPKNAADYRERAAAIGSLQRNADRGDFEAQVDLGTRLLRSKDPDKGGKEQGIAWLEKAAEQGHVETQYQLGKIFIFGHHGVTTDFERGRKWWDRAAEQNHVRTLQYVADAHLSGRYGYQVDLLKAKAQLEVLVAAYRHGRYGVTPDQRKAQHWESALKDIERRIAKLGGTYRPMQDLRARAEAGDPEAQYRLGQQLLESYSSDAQKEAMDWWNKAAANGQHEAQFKVAMYSKRGSRFMPKNHRRVVEFLGLAAEGKHPKAMLELGLAYEKGRYGLQRDFHEAKALYEELVQAGESNRYGWNLDEGFLKMVRIRL